MVSEEKEMFKKILLLIVSLVIALPLAGCEKKEEDFSETKEITGYSSKANTFYKTIPDESELIVKIVDKINSDTVYLCKLQNCQRCEYSKICPRS